MACQVKSPCLELDEGITLVSHLNVNGQTAWHATSYFALTDVGGLRRAAQTIYIILASHSNDLDGLTFALTKALSLAVARHAVRVDTCLCEG